MIRTEGHSIVIPRPKPTKKHPQNLCLDKGFDFPVIDELVEEWGYTGRIARRGVDQSKRKRVRDIARGGGSSRGRTHGMNRFRRLLIRWEEKKKNYVAMLHFACAWVTWQAAGLGR